MRSVLCTLVWLLFITPAPALSQLKGSNIIPDTHAGQVIRAAIAEIRRDSPDPRWLRWYWTFGAPDSAVVEIEDTARLRVWVQGTPTRGWLGLEAPERSGVTTGDVIAFDMNGRLPDQLAGQSVVPAEHRIAEIADAYLRELADGGFFSGAVAIARAGKPLLIRGYGEADEAGAIPITETTAFSLASVGKSFTAVALLQLEQEGKLSLDDTVGVYLPEYPHASVRGATVGQLLTHSAGVGRAAYDWIGEQEDRTLEELVRSTTAEPQFAPGTRARYSNEAFLLAGLIIERVTNMAFEDYVGEHVFNRSGMQHSRFHDWREGTSQIALPMTRFSRVDGRQVFVPGPRRSAVSMHGWKGSPAGGAFASVTDMLSFVQSLTDETLLSHQQFSAMIQARVRQPPPFSSFGYGVEVRDSSTPRAVGKTGAAQGVSTIWQYYPDTGYIIIVLSNYDAVADVVATRLEQLLPPH